MNNTDFGRNLKRARKAAGYSKQGDFASALQVSEYTVQKWEQGQNTPSLPFLSDICENLGCDADFLLGRIPEKNHTLHDICDSTGLSESAASVLVDLKRERDRLPGGTADNILRVINLLLDESNWEESCEFWRRIYAFIYGLGGDFLVPLDNGIELKRDDVLSALLLTNNTYIAKLKKDAAVQKGDNDGKH